jgi:nicotinamidase-related amidase
MQVVVPIDIQQGFADHAYWGGPRNNPLFETHVAKLLQSARDAGVVIVHVKHDSTNPNSPLRPGQAGNHLMAQAAALPGEAVLAKQVNSGFIGTDLETRLRAMGATELFAFGLTTDHCVSTTVRMAANLGFRTVLVGDACATFPKAVPGGGRLDAEALHQAHLASLADEFAEVITTEEATSRLARCPPA